MATEGKEPFGRSGAKRATKTAEIEGFSRLCGAAKELEQRREEMEKGRKGRGRQEARGRSRGDAHNNRNGSGERKARRRKGGHCSSGDAELEDQVWGRTAAHLHGTGGDGARGRRRRGRWRGRLPLDGRRRRDGRGRGGRGVGGRVGGFSLLRILLGGRRPALQGKPLLVPDPAGVAERARTVGAAAPLRGLVRPAVDARRPTAAFGRCEGKRRRGNTDEQ